MKSVNHLLILLLWLMPFSAGYANDTLPPPPEIRTVMPDIAYVNSHASLRGKNFGTDANIIRVFIDKSEVPLVFVKNDSLVFAVTASISNGAHTVTIERDGVYSKSAIIEIDTLNIYKTVRSTIGGIAFLLFGIFILSRGLRNFIGKRLFFFLPAMIRRPWAAFLSGMGISILTQSSTVAAVLLLGFVGAGFMPLATSIITLTAANIGSSVIALFLQFDIAKHSLWVVASGIFLLLTGKLFKREWYFDEITLGIGFVLYGMQLTMNSFASIADYSTARQLFNVFSASSPNGFLWCVVIGTVGTILLQSPAAFMIVLMGIAKTTMFVDFPSSIAMLLGANLAAVFTTLIIVHFNRGPGRTFILAHAIINIGGTLLATALFIPIIAMINAIIPFDPAFIASGKKIVHPYIGTHIAVGFLAINLVANLPFLFLYKPIAAWCQRSRITPAQPEEQFRQSLISHIGNESPEQVNALLTAEISRLFQQLRSCLQKIQTMFCDDATDLYIPIQEQHKNITTHSTQILSMLGTLSATPRNCADNRTIEHSTYITGELSRITRPIAALLETAITTPDLRTATHTLAAETIRDLTARIDAFITLVINIIDDPESYDRMEIRYLEITINRIEDLAKGKFIAAIGNGSCLPQHGQFLINVIGAYEQMGNTLYRIADFMFMRESRESATTDNF